MKNVIMFLFLAFIFVSCKKNDRVLSESKPYKVQKGILAFESFDMYRRFIESSTEEERKSFISEIERHKSFRSFHKLSLEKSIELRQTVATRAYDSILQFELENWEDITSSPFFGSLLNSNGMIQIDKYRFKVDYIGKKVLAIDTAKYAIDSSKFISGISTGKNIFEFSTEDEVLELLEVNNRPGEELFDGQSLSTEFGRLVCWNGEAHAQERHDKGTHTGTYTGTPAGSPGVGPCADPRMAELDCKLVYQRAGIYFSLLSKIKARLKNPSAPFGLLQDIGSVMGMDGSVRFKPRCRNEIQWSSVFVDRQNGSEVRRRPYESTRALSRYEFTLRFRHFWPIWNIDNTSLPFASCEASFHPNATSNTNAFLTRQYQIKWGY